jgi:TatD DNase family protein
MILTDVHSHLDHPKFNDLDEVIARAKEAGVKVIVSNGINPETNRRVLELSKKYDIVKAALGVYPVMQLKREISEGSYPLKNVEFSVDDELKFIEKTKSKIVAIGECGLDGIDKKWMAEQKDVFEKQIKLAKKLGKPIIVHSRKAEEDAVDMLEEAGVRKVVLHCFSGKKSLVKRAAELGYSFSIPTNVVFSEHFQNVVKEVNINQLFTETDAPYLGPFKGKRNEPANIIEGVKKIASIKGFEVEEVANNIWMNYQKLFS